MENYGYSAEEYGEDQFNRVTLHSCVTFLLDLESEKLNMTEEEFQQQVEQSDKKNFDRKAGLYRQESLEVKQHKQKILVAALEDEEEQKK